MALWRLPLAAVLALVALSPLLLVARPQESQRHAAKSASVPSPQAAQAALAKLPLAFEPNAGRLDPAARFVARGRGFTLFATDRGPVMTLARGKHEATVLRTRFVGSSHRRPRAEQRLRGVVNQMEGPKRNWVTGIHTYGQ